MSLSALTAHAKARSISRNRNTLKQMSENRSSTLNFEPLSFMAQTAAMPPYEMARQRVPVSVVKYACSSLTSVSFIIWILDAFRPGASACCFDCQCGRFDFLTD